MTQVNYTRGPWTITGFTTSCGVTIRANAKEYPNEEGSAGEIVALVKHIPAPDYITSMAEANARLIAAAPDLLAALETLLGEVPIEYDNHGNPMDKGLDKALQDAEAAIAMAKGTA